MKIAVLSDIHGNLPALQAVLTDVEAQGVDVVVNLGDIVSGPLLPAETAEFLMQRDWPTIAGNHERQLLRIVDGAPCDLATSDGYAATRIAPHHADWLRALPASLWLADDVLLVHGTPASDLEYWLETVTLDEGVAGSPGLRAATDREIAERLANGGAARGLPDVRADRASLVLCGHTHVPRIAQAGMTTIVNPGSVGLQAYDDVHPAYHRVENGSAHARYALVERVSRGWRTRLCAVPYDWEPMQRLALRNGRADWASALATGRLPGRLPRV